jgi:hypothetical protein
MPHPRPIARLALMSTLSLSTPALPLRAQQAHRPPQSAPTFKTSAEVVLHLSPRQAADVRPALKTLLDTTAQRGGAISLVVPWSKVSVAGLMPAGTATFNAAIDRIVGQRFEDRSSLPVSDAEALAGVRGDANTLSRLASRFMALNPNSPRKLRGCSRTTVRSKWPMMRASAAGCSTAWRCYRWTGWHSSPEDTAW